MINGKDVYHIFESIVPLYVALILGYCAIKWWKIFTPEQSVGINRFVSFFTVPALSFIFMYPINPYHMNWRLIVADSLQKIVTLIVLFLWNIFTKRGSFDWSITLFALTNLPNTLVVGIPLLNAMYGETSTSLLTQILFLQSLVWNSVLLLMYEYRAAKIFISQQFFNENNEESHKVDSNVDLEMEEIRPNFRRSSSKVTNYSGEEIYFNHKNNLRNNNFKENVLNKYSEILFMKSKSCTNISVGVTPHRNQELFFSKSINEGQRIINFNVDLSMPQEIEESKGVHELIDMRSSPKVSGDKEHEGEERQKEMLDIKEKSLNNEHQNMPPSQVMMTKLILIRTYKKLSKNPNIHASILAIVWALIASRWNIKMPSIIHDSVQIISHAGLGMSMFSIGIFMGLQPKIIACGKTPAAISMVLKFLVGPILFGATSAAVGIRGVILKIGIIQAALPQGIIPFVFSREYNLHAEIFNTSIIFGLAFALPVGILYYVILELF